MSHVAVGMHRHIRSSLHKAVADLSPDQLHAVPASFDNNIAWNLGHVLVVQQRMVYGRCGLPLALPEEMIPLYLPGTSPADWQEKPDARALVEMLLSQQEKLEDDYQTGRFDGCTFQAYTTTSGVDIPDRSGGLIFNTYHEGLHYGAVQALINCVG